MRRSTRLGVRVEEQLDGMDHQSTRLDNPVAVERGGRQRREVGRRQRARPRGQCGAHRRQPLQRAAVVHLGGARLRRPGADDQSGTRNLFGSKGFQRQRGVVQRAERRCHHDDTGAPRSTARSRSVTAVGAELDQQPTRTLDQGQPAGPVGAADHLEQFGAGRQRHPGCGGRGDRRQRLRVARQADEFGHPGQPADLGEIVVAVVPVGPGLHRFAHRDVDARQSGVTGQRRGGHRLAHSGSGAGDDDDAHGRRRAQHFRQHPARQREIVGGQRRARGQPQPRRADGHRRRAEAPHPHTALQTRVRGGERHLGIAQDHRHHRGLRPFGDAADLGERTGVGEHRLGTPRLGDQQPQRRRRRTRPRPAPDRCRR